MLRHAATLNAITEKPLSRDIRWIVSGALLCGFAWTIAQDAHAAPPAGSPYTVDGQETFVEDHTSQAIGTVNMISCFMANVKPDLMVNAASYAALVDMNRCDPSRRGNTASDAPDYTRAIVNSARASNSDPMTVKAWVERTENNVSSDIHLLSSLKQAATDTLPYGEFRLDYAAPNPSSTTPMLQGQLNAGSTGLTFVELENDGNRTRGTQLFLTAASRDNGSGAVRFADPDSGAQKSLTFAFSPTHFRRSDGTVDACFSRKTSDAKASVWRYGLYDPATGARVERNAGFPIKATVNGKELHAYIGAYGLSAPEDVVNKLTNGMTVTRETAPGQTGDSYTLIRSGGRLIKHTKAARSLDSIDGIPFDVPPGAALPGVGNDLRQRTLSMIWDKASKTFVVKGKTQCDDKGCRTSEISSPITITAAQMAAAVDGGLRGQSPAIGGQLFIPRSAMLDPATDMFYRSRAVVTPGASELANLTLYCVNNCPTPAGLQGLGSSGASSNGGGNGSGSNNSGPNAAGPNAASAQAASPFGASENRWGRAAANEVTTYTVNAVTGELQLNGQAVTFQGSRSALQGTRFGPGVFSSALVTSLSALTCPAQAPSGSAPGQPPSAPAQAPAGGPLPTGSNPANPAPQAAQTTSSAYCPFMAEQQDVFYTWETGPNPFNRFAGLKDANGNVVQFDDPLRVEWQVPADSSRFKDLAGKKLMLEYSSFGNLNGLPGHCVDRGTNGEVSCEANGHRYVPKLVIPDNETEGYVTVAGGTTRYLVKWLQRELRFAKVADSFCSAMTLGTLTSLPATTGLTDPSSAASANYIGAKPAVTAAPKVIHGVVQP